MKVLVIGGGAREHALALALSRDPAVSEVHVAPGNAGTTGVATNHPVEADDGVAVAALAGQLGADLVVIGPEVPLVAGVADAVRAAGIACFGPSAAAAQLEGSKAFAKDVMRAAGVPTAEARLCESDADMVAALDAFGPPYVVKDDGLAAGKGVVVTDDRALALAHAKECGRVVIEEFLDGPEVSLFAVTDGVTAVALQPAQDFKRVGDGDAGPNTGGMGAYSPLPWAEAGLVDEIMERVVLPTIQEMARRGTPFSGLLYAGLALTSRGLKVIEFNARFGDPETQVVLARLESPLAGLLDAAARGTLASLPALEWSADSAVTVVIASANYPGTPRVGDPIDGLAAADAVDAVDVLHAGTALDPVSGAVVSAGGRVLSVTATGIDLAAARAQAYRAVDLVWLAGSHHRGDIALRAAQDSTVGMDGLVCLQGGAEFGDACRQMDAAVLARAGGAGVVVVALAAEPGRDHDIAIGRAVGYYESLGATGVVGAPDARVDPAAALAAMDGARLVVLPGGSPSRLLNGLRESGADTALREALDRGAVVSGASAGAMVLCEWTLLPERGVPELVRGVGVVPGAVVLPHFSGELRWLEQVRESLPADVVVLGLPECSGLLVEGAGFTSVTAVGVAPTRLLGSRDGTLAPGSVTTL